MTRRTVLIAGFGLVALLAPRSTPAQTVCGTPVGPDLIAGGIQGITNFAVSGGYDAIGIGMQPANVGSAPVAYVASTAQHPVFGQALYRLRTVDGATRFEQVGLGWLRHGFFALSQTTHCPTCQATDGATLGVGCSDALSPALNADPIGLGPRIDVDAASGAHVHPPSNPPITGPHPRRLRVSTVDLALDPGARWFVETQCVAADDTSALHADDNPSWRELAVGTTGAEWTFTFQGPTVTEAAALRAWQAVDPAVTVVEARVPGEGLFLLGCAVTDLGGGLWRYEYALENVNSSRSARSLVVPLPAGLAGANVDFHDVAHHSGDGIGGVDCDGTDWSVHASSGAIAWESATFAQDPNANALRWSTTYNFRLDAAAPPVAGTVTVGLFAPGSPDAISVPATVPGSAPFGVYCAYAPGAVCPCGNQGLPGHGCANSVDASGARLDASGAPRLSADSLVLLGTHMPDSSALYFQGTFHLGGGAGTVFGDGLRCAGGSVVRLGTKTNVAGASQYPEPGDPPVSVRGLIPGPTTRDYQIWYRNAAAFCTPSTFNLSNGLRVTWSI